LTGDSAPWQCDGCGAEVSFEDNICPNCGADISDVADEEEHITDGSESWECQSAVDDLVKGEEVRDVRISV
jgi:predicted amidophosphoribosyltransferase